MKRISSILLAVFCGFALMLGAQSNPATQTEKAAGKTVTLSGCVKAGTEPNSFTLTNVSVAMTTTAEARPTELPRAESSYQLIGSEKIDLKAHVGHKVEVTGKIAGKGEATKPGEPAPPAGTAQTAKFNVDSIKHVGANCP